MLPDRLTVVNVHPDLLGLYGDRGNAFALRRQARLHGLEVDIVEVTGGAAVPADADVYLLGGAEDLSMVIAHDLLTRDRGLRSAIERGAPTLAVCAGLQLLGEEFTGPDGVARAGLGVLDMRCPRLPGPRAVGEILTSAEADELGVLTGFENHQGGAELGPAARPLGRLLEGVGNGDGSSEGVRQGAVIGTYLHGPVLVRNPRLAAHLLAGVLGADLPAVPEDEVVSRLREERIRATKRRRLWSR